MRAECVSAAAADSEPRWTLDKAQSQRSVGWLQRVWPRNTLQSSSPLDDGDRRSLNMLQSYFIFKSILQTAAPLQWAFALSTSCTDNPNVDYKLQAKKKISQNPAQFILQDACPQVVTGAACSRRPHPAQHDNHLMDLSSY